MSENEKIDKKKLREMEYLVLDLEDQNIKTKELSYTEMVDKIKGIIKTTLDKNY